MQLRRLFVLLIAGLALMGLLVACGDEPTPTPVPTATPVPPSPTPVPASPTPATGPASEADITLINDAITKTAGLDSYHYVVDLNIPGVMPGATNIEGDYKSPNKAHLTIKSDNQTQELINIGDTSYVKLTDGTWRTTSLADAGGAGGAAAGLGGLGAMAGGLDPTQSTNLFGSLSRFASGVNSAELLGTETVRGKPTAHYKVPLFLGNLLGTGGSTTPGETPLGYADMWIEPDAKQIDKMTVNLDLTDLIRSFSALAPTVGPDQPSPTPFPPVQIDMKIDLSNFGQVPDITPPADARPAQTPVGVSPANTSVPAVVPPTSAAATVMPAGTAVPQSAGTTTGSGAAILQQVMSNMSVIHSYHFTMTSAVNGAVSLTAEGDQMPPDRTSMDMISSAAGQSTSIKMVKIGADTWINVGGQWMKSPSAVPAGNPADLTGGLGSATVAEDLGDTTLDGAAVYHLNLTIANAGVPGAAPTQMEVWIEKSTNHMLQMVSTSEVTAAGTKSSVLTRMRLSRYDDPAIKIEAPAP
ncbi:MAG TPA: hypothetical protein VM536_07290 [Chloroflexia bacterium]|nr:hypothetical protein [Chloroflexia bacterium]